MGSNIFVAIWIDPNINNQENTKYSKELKKISNCNLQCFTNVMDALNYIKDLKFEETKIIVNGELYIEFIKLFINNIKDIKVIPKIVIFTNNKALFIENNSQYKDIINHSFYNFGGIKTTFGEIKQFLTNKNKSNKENDDILMTFEYIDNKAQLALPILYKSLIETTPNNKIEKYNKLLYKKYSKNKNIKELFEQFVYLEDIPIELLSKFYIRAYTMDSDFYRDINKDLGTNKRENYLPFIKILYEGIKFKAFPLASDKILYRGSKISIDELNKINNYLNKKNNDLPAAIVFSRSFLSFSKEKKIAEGFLDDENKNNKLYKVLYVLENDDNMSYSLSTHADIENISFFPNEKEVLFFPFSSFELKGVKEIILNTQRIYEIKLLYLGKYLEEIENDKNFIEKAINIPDSEFKKQITDSGLVLHEKAKNIKQVFSDYEKYKTEITNNINYKSKLFNIISEKNKIMELYYKLYYKGFVTDMKEIIRDGRIIAKIFILSKKYESKHYDKWIPAWHGTEFKYLESIVINGLKLPGKKLNDGTIIQTKYIPLKDKVDGIKNWENAIFASQNINYALQYCDEINLNKNNEKKFNNSLDYAFYQLYAKNREMLSNQWKGLVKIKINPNSFTKHKSNFISYYFGSHFSIATKTDIDDIYRIPLEKDIIITSIVFLNLFCAMHNYFSLSLDDIKD